MYFANGCVNVVWNQPNIPFYTLLLKCEQVAALLAWVGNSARTILHFVLIYVSYLPTYLYIRSPAVRTYHRLLTGRQSWRTLINFSHSSLTTMTWRAGPLTWRRVWMLMSWLRMWVVQRTFLNVTKSIRVCRHFVSWLQCYRIYCIIPQSTQVGILFTYT